MVSLDPPLALAGGIVSGVCPLLLIDHGVGLHIGRTVAEVAGSDGVEGVALDDGTRIEVDWSSSRWGLARVPGLARRLGARPGGRRALRLLSRGRGRRSNRRRRRPSHAGRAGSLMYRLFIALAGAITLASGAAAYARLSPLLPTMLIGAILANTARNRHEIGVVLHRVHRPLYLVLLIFAGAAWRVPGRGWVIPLVAFVVIRLVATLGSARLATRLSGMSGALGRDWGMALIGQGSLAAAIALNYRIFDDSDLSNVVFTVALVSVLATDLLSARVVRAVVRRHHRRVPVPAGLGER